MKKFLVSLLLICGVVLPCFSSATFVTTPTTDLSFKFVQSSSTATYTNSYGVFCLFVDSNCRGNNCGTITVDGVTYNIEGAWSVNGVPGNNYCTDGTNIKVSGLINYYYYFLITDNFFDTWKPDFTSLQCQTEYNLIPISSVDSNYCTTNNLCPSVDCPEYPDNPNVGTSNLYINDVFHPGAFNVIVNIPEEIDWDYAYTNSGSNFNLDIVGYNQDFELIEDWVATNNYKPTSDDFTNIFISGFSKLGGLLVSLLFIILVFYLVKKRF